jgi:uncharacterized protein YbaP (TraB family)
MRLLFVGLLLFANAAFAQTAPAEAPATQALDEVVVSGERAGPRMWQVSKGDHVLWLLGTPGPLPKKMNWQSNDVERAIADSQQVLAGFTVKPKINLFNALPLYLQYRRIIQLPNKQTLQDWLTPSQYQRYAAVKTKYLPKDDDLDRRRPLFVLQALGRAARNAGGLDNHVNVTSTVMQLAEKHAVDVIRQTTRLDDPKEILKEVNAMPRASEVSCFAAGLDTLESDVTAMKARANAWSLGDVAALRQFQSELKIDELRDACEEAISSAPTLKAALAQARDAWFDAASRALEKNTSTVALASMEELLRENGILARFRAQGYKVEGP